VQSPSILCSLLPESKTAAASLGAGRIERFFATQVPQFRTKRRKEKRFPGGEAET
jgi:hypothetical protein